MKRLGRIWMVVGVVGMVVGSAQGKYGGGTGEPNDPYQIGYFQSSFRVSF